MTTKNQINDNTEKLSTIFWLIERTDALRQSSASRAATVVSADALLLAAMTFMLDKALPLSHTASPVEKAILGLAAIFTSVFLFLSLITALTGITSVWHGKPGSLKDIRRPQSPFVNPLTTASLFSDFSSFEESFRMMSNGELLKSALSELMLVQHLYDERWRTLGMSIKFLVFSIPPFGILLINVLIRLFQ